MAGHSELCDNRRCSGCDDSDFDPDNMEVECQECDAELTVGECGEGRSPGYLSCPECGEDIYVAGDDGDHAQRRAEAGYSQ